MLKKYSVLFLFTAAFFNGLSVNNARAQTIKLLAGNTLNGAINGVMMGGATMALKNSDDFGPARIGLGAGALYGIGVGVYDIARISKGQQFYISGTFNDGTNTSILVLLDTFYGAAGGAIIGSSISLIFQKSVVDALQYGSGSGAWVGFGFGLVDAFILARGPDFGSQTAVQPTNSASGFLTFQSKSKRIDVGMISADLIQQKTLTQNNWSTEIVPTVNVINLNIRL